MLFNQHENNEKHPRLPVGNLGVFMMGLRISLGLLLALCLTTGASQAIAFDKTKPKPLIAMLPVPLGVQSDQNGRIVLPEAPLHKSKSFKADVLSKPSQAPTHPQATSTAAVPPVQLLQVEDEGVTIDSILPVPEAPAKLPETASTTASLSTPLLPTNPLNGFDTTPSKPQKAVKKIVINIPARQLSLYEGNTLLKTYPVGVGRAQFPTPVGHYQVIRKVLNPGWENPYMAAGKVRIQPGIDNPLGTRWIGFKEDGKGEYGIHGTDNPPSVGKYSSHGCVRMYIKQAEELYSQVSMGTPVDVVYQPVVIQQKENQLWVTVYPDALKRGLPSLKTLQAQIQQQYPMSSINATQLQQALTLQTQKPILIGQMPVTKQPIATEQPTPAKTTISQEAVFE